jgi:hypothetical protein
MLGDVTDAAPLPARRWALAAALLAVQALACFLVVAALDPGWGYVIGLSAVLAVGAPAWWRVLD